MSIENPTDEEFTALALTFGRPIINEAGSLTRFRVTANAFWLVSPKLKITEAIRLYLRYYEWYEKHHG